MAITNGFMHLPFCTTEPITTQYIATYVAIQLLSCMCACMYLFSFIVSAIISVYETSNTGSYHS